MNSKETYGLLGKELSHSFSPEYFAKKFNKEKIDATYNIYPLEEIDQFQTLIKEVDFKGLNVTIPYKEVIIPFLDELDPAAAVIGAVNTILFQKNKRIGYNTDYQGFYDSLCKSIDIKKIRSSLILGTGGASKSVQYALSLLQIPYKQVSRNPQIGQIGYKDIDKEDLADSTLIVNTTPLGTWPNIKQYPDIPFDLLNDTHILFDLVYNPPITTFMKKGIDRGASSINGYEMLVNQAELSWKIWKSNQ